jgi:hypothetical protein
MISHFFSIYNIVFGFYGLLKFFNDNGNDDTILLDFSVPSKEIEVN